LVDLCESYDDARTYEHQITKLIQKLCPKMALNRRGSELGLRLYWLTNSVFIFSPLRPMASPVSSPYLLPVQKPTLLSARKCQDSTDTWHYRFLRDPYQFILSPRYFTPT